MINEEQLDVYLTMEGDQTDPSRDWLIAEDNKGQIIGFACLLKSSKRDSWWMEVKVIPEYHKSKLSVNLFESLLDLVNKPKAPQILFSVRKYIFVDSPLQVKIKEMGIKTVHFHFWMRLDEIDSLPKLIIPSDINFQKQKDITDFASYVSVINDAFSKHFDFRPYTEDEFKQLIQAEWKELDDEHWLVIYGNKLVGLCSVIINPELNNLGIVDNLGVIHSYHHRGIGSSLLSFGVQSLIEKGCKTIELGVEANNEKALSLYKKFGFYEVESRTNIIYAINL